jgi:hypothetical protein
MEAALDNVITGIAFCRYKIADIEAEGKAQTHNFIYYYYSNGGEWVSYASNSESPLR